KDGAYFVDFAGTLVYGYDQGHWAATKTNAWPVRCVRNHDASAPVLCSDGVDDPACGTISCASRYVQSGTESATATETCKDRADITSNRCEGFQDCKDANTADCNSQSGDTTKYTCGTCKYIAASACTGTTLGGCTNYASGTSCGNGECDGAGNCVWASRTLTSISPTVYLIKHPTTHSYAMAESFCQNNFAGSRIPSRADLENKVSSTADKNTFVSFYGTGFRWFRSSTTHSADPQPCTYKRVTGLWGSATWKDLGYCYIGIDGRFIAESACSATSCTGSPTWICVK
ncbi:hypothetical protein JYT91_01460, partial [archaeon AH-315-M20]|nr:hypothetical protein [archaeon AH-315-M20]